MLTKTLLALNATLSQRPETNEQRSTGTSECAGSISSRNPVIQDGWEEAVASAEPEASSEGEDGRVLTPGVLKGVAISLDAA